MNGASNAIVYRYDLGREGGGRTKGILPETEPQSCPLVTQVTDAMQLCGLLCNEKVRKAYSTRRHEDYNGAVCVTALLASDPEGRQTALRRPKCQANGAND